MGMVLHLATETDNGNSGASKTITWSTVKDQKLTLTADCTLTFVSPGATGPLTLKLIQDSTGGRNVQWPSSCINVPVLSPIANATNIVTFYSDGTNYHLIKPAGVVSTDNNIVAYEGDVVTYDEEIVVCA